METSHDVTCTMWPPHTHHHMASSIVCNRILCQITSLFNARSQVWVNREYTNVKHVYCDCLGAVMLLCGAHLISRSVYPCVLETVQL